MGVKMDLSKSWKNMTTEVAKNIEIVIEELVLHGFPHGDRYRIAGALEQELTRLFAETEDVPRMFKQASYVEAIDGGQCRIEPEAGRIGLEIAQAVYRGVGK